MRLDAVGRALTIAQDAYASALAERDELRARLEAYAAKATLAASGPAQALRADLDDLARRVRETLDAAPADLVRARALMAAYQAYLGALPTRGGGSIHQTRGGHR